MTILLSLFLRFCQIGILGFGGGYAILPLIQDVTVQTEGWLTQAEFTNLVTISQLTPGPILLNSATFVGTKMAGIPGGLVATLGSVTPSFFLILLLSMLYFRYRNLNAIKGMLRVLKPAVVGLIASAGAAILLSVLFPAAVGGWRDITGIAQFDIIGLALAAGAYAAIARFKVNPMVVIAAGGLIGGILYSLV